MIPSTLLIVLFVQWTSSWIDFTLILPLIIWWSCDDNAAADEYDNDDGGGVSGNGEEYLAIHDDDVGGDGDET